MFKIGQKVVCKDNSECPELIVGKIYIVHNIDICPACGAVGIFISPPKSNKEAIGICKCCGTFAPCQDCQDYRASRFEPLKYDLISNKDIIKEMVPERLDVPEKEPAELQKE